MHELGSIRMNEMPVYACLGAWPNFMNELRTTSTNMCQCVEARGRARAECIQCFNFEVAHCKNGSFFHMANERS